MRDKDRIPKVLVEIGKIWVENPDLRLCQLIGNCFQGDLYYLEDDELLRGLNYTYREIKNGRI